MSNEELDALKSKTQGGTRLDDEPEEPEFDPNDFQEEFLKQLGESEGKVGSRNLSVNDPLLWSVMAALDENEDRKQELREKAEVSRESRSALLSKLLRVGLAEVHPELSAEINEAYNNQSDDPVSR